MSYAEMRKALEAVQGDMEEIGHIKASIGKQVDDALKSTVTTSELVSELRKRDGVKIWDVTEEQFSTVEVCQQDKELSGEEHPRKAVHCIYRSEQYGKAKILRITD